jgi:GT2 family glycosyltransferase
VAEPTPELSVIVVTYRTGPVVLDCIDALRRHRAGVPTEVIVVANGVDDVAADPVLSAIVGDDVRVIGTGCNLGFAGGNEFGVLQSSGRLLAFVNPDLVVEAGCLRHLVTAVSHRSIAIAGPVLLNDDGSVQEDGGVVCADGTTANRTMYPNFADPAGSSDVEYSSACCWMVRREVHEHIGGFSAHFHPAYFEDADYALRARALGYRIRVVSEARAMHAHGSSVAGGPSDGARLIATRTWRRFSERWRAELADHPPRPSDRRSYLAAMAHVHSERVGVIGDHSLPAQWTDDPRVSVERTSIDADVPAWLDDRRFMLASVVVAASDEARLRPLVEQYQPQAELEVL